MRELRDYLERAESLRVLLAEDDAFGPGVSARHRLSYFNRAVRVAESGISRIDPLFSEVRTRYVSALFAAKPKSSWLRSIVGTAIREVCETHGPDHSLVEQLRSTQVLAWEKRGKPVDDKITQVQAELDKSPGYVSDMRKLVDLYRKAGQYDAMMSTYDKLVAELTGLGLSDIQLALIQRNISDIYFDHGEMLRATQLLESVYRRDDNRNRKVDIPLNDLTYDSYLQMTMARCYLATNKPGAAETILRESRDRLRRHEDKLHNRYVYRLRHRTIYELGSAVWKQNRPQQAKEYFQEAHQLVSGPKQIDEQAAPVYYSASVYSRMQAGPK
jgi:tetratricopeptide (TPR) repeat protein